MSFEHRNNCLEKLLLEQFGEDGITRCSLSQNEMEKHACCLTPESTLETENCLCEGWFDLTTADRVEGSKGLVPFTDVGHWFVEEGEGTKGAARRRSEDSSRFVQRRVTLEVCLV